MFLFTVLLVPALCVVGGLAANDHTYQRTDPVTGQKLLCNRCPPGTRLRAHCTRSLQTECVPCGAGLFTEFWNYIPDCLRCDACSDHQRVVRPCNGTVNTLCECEAGFYWDQHFCRRHSVCKPGHGLKASGTPHRDTVCEPCADGNFADVRQVDAVCVTHSACKTDEQLVLPGSRWHDSVCATCDKLTLKVWVGVFEAILSALEVQYGIPADHLQKLVNRRLRRKRFGKRAAEDELLNLPSILEETQHNHLADIIARRIRQFHHHCNSTAL